MRILSIIAICLVILTTTTEAQEQIRLSGKIFQNDSLTILLGSHLIVNGERGTSTDLNGDYVLDVNRGDTLFVSHLGFHSTLFIVPQKPEFNSSQCNFYLIPDTTLLEQIEVYPWPNRDMFAKEFMDLELDGEEVELNLDPVTEDKSVSNVGAGGISMNKMFKYKNFYKLDNEKKELDAWVRNERRNDYVSARLKKTVKTLTGMEDQQIEEFVKYCHLGNDFVESASDYDLAVAVSECYQSYSKN